MAGTEDFVDYRQWMNQALVWPSAGPGGTIDEQVIEEMSPQHAVSAYRKLGRWCLNGNVPSGSMPTWNTLRKSPLARELMLAALGEEVVYAFELQVVEGQREARRQEAIRLQRQTGEMRAEISRLQADLREAEESLVELREVGGPAGTLERALTAAGVTIVINTRGGRDDD